MASQREVLQRARELSRAVTMGAIQEEELNDKGQVLLQLGRGDVGVDKLNDEEIDLIGLDRPWHQRAGRAVTGAVTGTAEKVGELGERAWPGAVGPPVRTRPPATEFFEATKEAAQAPGIAEMMRQGIGGEPGVADLFLRALSGVEKPLQWLFSPLAGAGAVAEQIVEQVPRLGGQAPASTPVSRGAGLATEMLPPFVPAARVPRLHDARRGIPSTGGTREPRIERPQEGPLALPPGPPEIGTTTIPGGAILKPERVTRRQLEAAPERKALPPARAGAAEEVLADIGPPRGIPALPAFDPLPKMLTGRVVGQTVPLPAERIPRIRERRLAGTVPLGESGEAGALQVGKEVPPPRLRPEAHREAPVKWTGWQETLEEPLPLWTLTEAIEGHPVGSTIGPKTLRDLGFKPPEPPEAPPVKKAPRPPVGPKETPSYAPPPGSMGPPTGVVVPPEARTEALSTMYNLLAGAEPGERIFIRNKKGTKVESVIGKSSSYPAWMVELGVPKTRKGADRLMKAIDNVMEGTAAGSLEQRVEKYVERAWPEYVERARGGYLEDIPSPPGKDVSPAGKAAPGGAQATTRVRAGEVESPKPPMDLSIEQWEWDKMGSDQRRGIIDFFRSSDEELAKGGLSGLLPPIPVPGPEEEEKGSLAGWIKQSAQVLGLAAPMLAMVFRGRGRSRSTRKQSGRPGGPADEGLFRDAPDKPRYEVTPEGQQALVPGTPGRAMPRGPVKPEVPQKDVTETPLFGQERVAREAASDKAQGGLDFDAPPRPIEKVPAPVLEGPAGLSESISTLNKRRDAVLARIKALEEQLKIGRGEAAMEGAPELEGQVPLTDRLKGLYDHLSDLNGKIARAERLGARKPDSGGKLLSATATGAVGAEAASRMIPEAEPYGVPLPPMEDAIDQELDRLQEGKGRKPQDQSGPPVMAAGWFPRLRPPRVPRAPVERAPRTPAVPEQFRRETIRPPRQEAPPAGRPPVEPPGPPTGAMVPEPPNIPELREGPMAASKYWLWDKWALPIVSRFEQMGRAGGETSRTIANKFSQEQRWYGQNAQPVVDKLRRLTPEEKENFRQVVEEGAQPMNDRVRDAQAAYGPYMGVGGAIDREARARNLFVLTDRETGEGRPFQARRNFFPHEFPPEYVDEVIKPGSQRRQEAIEHLMNTGQATGPEDAAAMLDERFGRRTTTIGGRIYILDPDRFVGGLERTRDINLPGYIKDPAAAVAIRSAKVARRFAELDHYGRLDANIGAPGGTFDPMTGQRVPAHGFIGQIQRERGYLEAQRAFEMFQRVLGRRPLDEVGLEDFARKVRSFEAFTKLPLATIANASQPTMIGVRANLTTMAQGLVRTIQPGGYKAGERLGAMSEMALREFYADVSGRKPTTIAGRVAMGAYEGVEKFVRAVGAHAGEAWAETLEARLRGQARPRDVEWLRRELTRLNFSPEEIQNVLRARRFSDDDKGRVAWGIADQTMFLMRTPRRSEFFNTPLGSIMGQFKQFTANAARMLREAVIDEAKAGNYAPLARMLALFPVAGEAVQDVKALVRGTERPDDPVMRLLDNFFAVGAASLVTDLVKQAFQMGRYGIASFMAGPAFSDAFTLAERLARTGGAVWGNEELAIQRQLEETGRFALKQVPYVGPPIAERLRTDPRGEARARQTWQERLRVDPEKRQLRELESISRQARTVLREANKLAADGRVEDAQDLIRRFNEKHGTRLRLSPSSVRQRRRQEQDPEAARRRGISPGVRGRLPEVPQR